MDRYFFATQLILRVGHLLGKGFGNVHDIKEKSGRHNLVTEYDTKSERLIVSEIKNHFPQDSILGEEEGKVQGSNEYQWVIDPLDGTVNFAHNIPLFSVSIGLRKSKETILGLIFNPIANELFLAEKGSGAFLNGEKIKVSDTKEIKDSFLSLGFPYNLKDNPNNCIEKTINVLKLGLPIRRFGVASLDLAYLATGRNDIFFEISLQPWDLCAGVLMLEEAGGMISTWTGEKLDIENQDSILATNSSLHSDMINLLK